MLQTRKIGARHYYEFLPDQNHRCGDIWSSLPAQGLLGHDKIQGIVITPACDLANNKAETIIYLPIIPVRSYFGTPGAFPELRDRLNGLFQTAKFDPSVSWQPGRYRPPNAGEIDRSIAAIQIHLTTKQRGQKESEALARAIAGLTIIRQISTGVLAPIETQALALLFGNDWTKIKSEIVKNAFRADLHFLPRDDQESGFSGLRSHSVVLFRYPLTAPVEVLDLAQNTPADFWPEACSSIADGYPAATAFQSERPIKILSLKNEFLADLLNRYCAVYSRIGSPDFTPQSIARIGQEVDL